MDSKMQWFKFYGQDWLTDLKIITMTPMDKLVFIYLLCLVSISETPGLVRRCTEQTLLKMFQLGDQLEAFGCLARLEKLGMILVTQSNETDFLDVEVVNFRKRQERALTASERQALYRERKREGSNEEVTDALRDVTNSNDGVTLEKRRIEKNREEKIILPDWLNSEAWAEWEQHRREIKEKQTPLSVKKQINLLERFKEDHVEIINQSIQNGWKGLFELKGRSNKPQQVYTSKIK
jgi:hypothetical protein